MKLEVKESSTDSDGNQETEYKTVFKGQLIKLQLGKHLESGIRIKERRMKRKRNGVVSGFMKSILESVDNYHEVEMENEAFNERYEVKARDPHTAFYILTPSFMEHLLSADDKAKAHTNICFEGDYVYISLNNNHDSFEINSKIKNQESLDRIRRNMQQDLRYMLSVIDELLKNHHLFEQSEREGNEQ